NGTVAYIGGNVTAGGDVSVEAKETATANILVGQGVGGLAAFGAAVAVLNVHSNTQAFLASGAVIDATGTVAVKTSFNENTSVKVYQGTLGGLLGLGVEIAINNDDSNQLAYAADGARIDRASAVTVTADANRTVYVDAGGVNVGGAVIGAAEAV